MDAFSRELGTRQGRIEPSLVAPIDGDWVCCLGLDGVRSEELAEGDFVQIAQTAAFTSGTKVFRVNARVQPPPTAPTGLQWALSLMVDSVVAASIVLVPGDRLRTRSLAANVSKATAGTHTIAIILELVST